jgi:hypothetical protein
VLEGTGTDCLVCYCNCGGRFWFSAVLSKLLLTNVLGGELSVLLSFPNIRDHHHHYRNSAFIHILLFFGIIIIARAGKIPDGAKMATRCGSFKGSTSLN